MNYSDCILFFSHSLMFYSICPNKSGNKIPMICIFQVTVVTDMIFHILILMSHDFFQSGWWFRTWLSWLSIICGMSSSKLTSNFIIMDVGFVWGFKLLYSTNNYLPLIINIPTDIPSQWCQAPAPSPASSAPSRHRLPRRVRILRRRRNGVATDRGAGDGRATPRAGRGAQVDAGWWGFCRDIQWYYGILIVHLVGGLEHFIFSIYWECHHPNWLIFFRGVGQPPTNHYNG